MAGGVFVTLPVTATPVWKAPSQLKLGELQVLELREVDASQPAPPRPAVEDRLGPLRVRSLEPLPDGRGWRFQVQALEPGIALIPAEDLGNGLRMPELRLEIPRTIPYGGPWVGFGGGNEDRLPAMPFPVLWSSLLLTPFLLVGVWLLRRWGRGTRKRQLQRALGSFCKAWPPPQRTREALDAAHHQGRELLALRFGDQAQAWGPKEFQAQHLAPWDQWVKSLDAARFGCTEPPFPTAQALVRALQARRDESPRP